MSVWGRPSNPSGKQLLEAEANNRGRMVKMRARRGGTAFGAKTRTVVAWFLAAVVLALMTNVVLVWLGQLMAAAFAILAIAVCIWLYRQFRSYG